MKFLAIAFSFYMTLLMLMPCQDKTDTSSAPNVNISIHQDSETKDDCSQDFCPPFCSCACCSVGKNLPLETVAFTIESSTLSCYAPVGTFPITKQPFAIWQPPKLV